MKEVNIKGIPYKCVEMTPGLLSEFTHYFNIFRNKKFSINYFQKKYSNILEEPFYIGFLLYHNDQIVAHFGCIPYNIKYQGRQYKFAQLTDTLTHPDYQNRGLNKFLTEHLIEHLKNAGFSFVFSFSKELTAKIRLEHYGWEKITSVYNYTEEVKTVPLNKIFNKLGWYKLYNIYIKFMCSFFSNKLLARDSDKLKIPYNKDLVNYKKYESNFIINISGHSIWFKIDDGISIGYTSMTTKEDYEKVLNKLKSFCKIAGFHQLKLMILENSPEYIFFKEKKLEFVNLVVGKNLTEEKIFDHLELYNSDRNTF